MALRLLRFRGISTVLYRRTYSDSTVWRRLFDGIFASSLYRSSWKRNKKCNKRPFSQLPFRCSLMSEAHRNVVPSTEILTFIKSTLNVHQGPNHCWFNNINDIINSFGQDGVYLVLVNSSVGEFNLFGSREQIILFERMKLLQHRYPKLNAFALQSCTSVNSVATHAQIIQIIMEEYITYPILLSDMEFMKTTNGGCYLLFDGLTNRSLHLKLDTELGSIMKVIDDFDVLEKESAITIETSDVNGTRQLEVIKEPSTYFFRNLPLYYPGCVSVDEDGNRIFISDSNHHRILITDGNGKVLDCIGSSPGFEDGDFESAKLMRPAASFYNAADDCLYFVDSENHAIRRAYLEKRVLETLYPLCTQKSGGIWSWILEKLGLAREVAPKLEEFGENLMDFPWHLMKIEEDDFLVVNRSFETSWILSMASGDIRRVIKGASNIMETCGHVVKDKVSLLKQLSYHTLSRLLDQCIPVEGIPYAGLMSSIAEFQKYIILCDAGGQGVLKCHRENQDMSSVQLSNLGLLGLPYWLVCPLERVLNSGYSGRPWLEHVRDFNVLPGRCDIQVFVKIPTGTEFAAPLDERCIWRQARGSAAELSGPEGAGTGTEKVGVAQQWFDELDNLAFVKSGAESSLQDEEVFLHESFQDKDQAHFNCAVNISPGTSEVVVSAVLYLKLKRTWDDEEEQKLVAKKILGYQKHVDRNLEEETCIKLLLQRCRDVCHVTFMKPLHLRIKLECGDHPAAETNKETISTDTTVKVDVSLD